jgi:hypothetical protein
MLFASSAGGPSSGPIVLFFVAVTLVVAFIFQRRAERRAMFQACATAIGAQLVDADTDTFTATVRGLRLVVELAAGGKNSPEHTYVTMKATAPFALVLYLRLRTTGEERAIQKGDADDILIGDPVLDAAWLIEGAPRERVVRMLEDPTLRAKLRAFRGVNEPNVVLEDDHVLVSRRDFDTRGNVMATERIELALALAEAAVAESARDLPVNEGAADYRTVARRPDGRGERAQIETLARVRASREIVKARAVLVLGQLAAPGMLFLTSMTMRRGAVVPALVPAAMLIAQAVVARSLGGPYLKLLRRTKCGMADHVALVVIGMANVFLVSQILSALVR